MAIGILQVAPMELWLHWALQWLQTVRPIRGYPLQRSFQENHGSLHAVNLPIVVDANQPRYVEGRWKLNGIEC